MQQILDLHIHSKYSRACSRDLTLENIDKRCRIKGVNIIATGDFTHPFWFKNIKEKLEPLKKSNKETGLYKLKNIQDDKIKFILSTEISLIYKDKDKTRRIHLIVHAPNIQAVENLNKYLQKKGFNIQADGRPILGMNTIQLIEICLAINPQFLIYPAHIWTPWFSVFGSKSGFNSFEECFQEKIEYIYAYETGLSSDPIMNWRLSSLDKLTLLSNSDAHSLLNIGREANIFELEEMTYNEIYQIIKEKDLKKIKATIEFYPEEGMYHFDGHRICGVSFSPQETKKIKSICPICRKPLVIGVLNRVEELADRFEGIKPKKAYNFIKLVELDKIIIETLNIKSRYSKKANDIYYRLIAQLGPELQILINEPLERIRNVAGELIAQGVDRVRLGKLNIKPGFDGEYGVVKIFSEEEKVKNKQQSLF